LKSYLQNIKFETERSVENSIALSKSKKDFKTTSNSIQRNRKITLKEIDNNTELNPMSVQNINKILSRIKGPDYQCEQLNGDLILIQQN